MSQPGAGKTAIVTGAGSGICLEFARLLLNRGVNVVFCDLALRPEAQSVLGEFKSKAIFHKTDVTSWEDLAGAFKIAQRHFGTVDIVCPGAGIFEPPASNFWIPPGAPASRDSSQGGRYLNLDVNLVHPIRMTQMAIAYFLAADPPVSRENPKSVVLTASIASESASLYFPLYHAAKHGIFGFIKSLANLEKHLGIRVTGVLPGMVRTPIWTEAPEKMKMLKLDQDRPGVWIKAEDVGKVMLALVEDDDTNSIIGLGATRQRIQGGTCLEVLPGSVRDVPLLNNIGPLTERRSEEASDQMSEVEREIIEELKSPGWGKKGL
ncbi:hypothetical protein NM208_g1946 [Fusarium decemcellulare]|uniref:Uncharacterized protein n=1 Tax=Fusarium decemcellulare TaxID=57161 RepID=A0ACC1SUI7_9HYPO|nr:hypothetical protein NM208_g1946 [Fusarium decemcellulare]